MKFVVLIVETHVEGTVSQIFHLGLKFYFMKSRMNVLYRIPKLQSWVNHRKLEIYIQKIKV